MSNLNKQLNTKVSWKVFVWVISILTALIGGSFRMTTSAMTKVEGYNQDIIEIKLGIQEIRTDQKWIIQTLNTIR